MNAADKIGGFCEYCGAQLVEDARFCSQCGMKVGAYDQTSQNDPVKQMGTNGTEYRLFQVYSIVNSFLYNDVFYDNLKINWFAVDRQAPLVPFENVIFNYIRLNREARVAPGNYINQHFSFEEAEYLKNYLLTKEKMGTVIEPCSLPIPENMKGYRDMPPSLSHDFLILHKRKEYNLSFKVEGIFDIRTADCRIMPDDRITVVTGINVNEIRERLKKSEQSGT